MRDDANLWQEHELCRFLFEGSKDAVVITSVEGRIRAMNRAARTLRGVDVQRLLEGMASGDLDLAAFRAALRSEGRATAEIQIEHPDGKAHGEARTLVLDGTALGASDVIVLRDVTEVRNLEKELWHLRRVESVGHLTASVVHDFNNLLTPIVCLSALLTNELDESGAAGSMARDIRSASERAAGLVRQVLALVRRVPSPLERVNVSTLVSELGGLVERMVGKEVTVTLDLERDLGDAKIDREQLEHVLLNLAANARDAMPRGGHLSIRTANVTLGDDASVEEGPKSGAYVVLSVSDTGTGMAKEVRERIFERFFTTKDIGKGTGLGLATAHRFVTQSGGCIAVRSEVGQGTTVSIYLPRAKPAAPSVLPPRSMGALPAGTETILVVEDDDQVRRVVRTVLEELGYSVIDAPSGASALDRAAKHEGKIHLVLTDLVMPEMSGHDFVERLRPTLGTTRVLFMSGHTDKTIVDYGLDGRDDAILRKAFSPTELAHKVREVLDAA